VMRIGTFPVGIETREFTRLARRAVRTEMVRDVCKSVPGALMIEPTESEPKEELDLFIDAMKSIAEEVEEDPQTVLDAPHSTRVSRLDETAAARKPVLRWKPGT